MMWLLAEFVQKFQGMILATSVNLLWTFYDDGWNCLP